MRKAASFHETAADQTGDPRGILDDNVFADHKGIANAVREGVECWALLHVEVQTTRDAEFPRRMYVYNYRVFNRYNVRVVSPRQHIVPKLPLFEADA